MPSEHPDPELAGYRPVNGWAVAALLLGFIAPMAFAHPLLWWVPLVGIAIAIVALLRIRRADIPTVGRKAAIVGLVLSLAIATSAPTRYLTRNYWLVTRAEELADRWFERIRAGQTQQAFDLIFHVPPRHASPPHGDSAAPPEDAEKTGLETFLARADIVKLLALGDRAQPRHVETAILPEEMGRQTVSLAYQIESPNEHSPQPFIVQLQTQRRIDPDGQERWLIQSVWSRP
jgi:hypothetical protein